MKYRAYCRFSLDKERILKIEEILKDIWRVEDPVINQSSNGDWEVFFSTDDHKKVYKLVEIIKEKYEGKVHNFFNKKIKSKEVSHNA